MEILIVIAVFAVCASVCVKIFVGSYFMARESREMRGALTAAKNGAECFKAYGDPERTAAVLNGRGYSPDGSLEAVVYYNPRWHVCGEAEAAYVLRIKSRASDESTVLPLLCDLSVEKITGEEVVGFIVATRRRAE